MRRGFYILGASALASLVWSGCSAGSDGTGSSNTGSFPGAGSAGNGGAGNGGAPTGNGGVVVGTGAYIGEIPSNGGNNGSGGVQTIDDLRNASCATNTERTESLPAVLEFVVDTSGSMGQAAPGVFLKTKWDVTREALRGALNSLPPATGVGIMYFPEKTANASRKISDGVWETRAVSECLDLRNAVGIDVAGQPGSPHLTQVVASLDAFGRPNGGTPTHDAYKIGIDTMSKTTLPGNRFVILITDGQPTYAEGCAGTGQQKDANDPRPIIEEARRAAANGIRTFVIGSPGSQEANARGFPEARTWLSMMATAGGTATPGCNDNGPNFCHFDMTTQTDFSKALQDTLQLIVGSVVGCSYPIPTPTGGGQIDRDKVNVVYTPAGGVAQLVGKFTGTGTCVEGWQYSADGNTVDLCQGTCDRIRNDADPQLDVIFGCSTQTEIPR